MQVKSGKYGQYIAMSRDAIGQLSYRIRCYAVENERYFGDIVVTQQTLGGLYVTENWQVSSLRVSRGRNLAQETLETPDFMELNRFHGSRKRKTTDQSKDTLRVCAKYNCPFDEHRYFKGAPKQRIWPLPVLREFSDGVAIASLVDQLLLDIYGYPRADRLRTESDSTVSSFLPQQTPRYVQRARLCLKNEEELAVVLETLRADINHAGGSLIRQLRRRDYLRTKRDRQYDVITAHLQAYSNKRSEDTRMRFSLTPQPGESGFTQWLDAMKMVARLSGGIPQEFRKRLWLTLAERHLEQRGVDWKQAEKLCFNEWTNPDDEELGIQIVKDLHRTGCSLFCGAAGRDNQAVLRRVLLGFARWNKSVGYCQGLNVLAALILQVTDRAEASAVKVMIYLIEGVLPEGYFADNLRGLSVDMAVFRDLLRLRLPKLSKHLEALQCDNKDKATGSSYEPPLTNVFTMQWFLTLFCHCLPQDAVLRVWDLIFLEGDEVLLRTALAIWEGISDRIMTVTSADEFYSIMGVLTREMLEFSDTNHLIKKIVSMGPLHGVTDLREKHRYNITPWTRRLSDDEDTDTDEERLAVAAAVMLDVPHRFKKVASGTLQTLNSAADRDKLALDINTLKQQYAKLRERQRQTHIILSGKEKSEKPARQTMLPSSTSQAMNHLLVGKSALVSTKTRQLGPPPGSIPPKSRVTSLHSPRAQNRRDKGVTLHWKDTKKSKSPKNESAITDEGECELLESLEEMSSSLKSTRRGSTDSDSDSTSTELCDEPDRFSDSEEPTSTSDYVMATDDEKSPRLGSSPISESMPSRSLFNEYTQKLSPTSKNGCDTVTTEETSSSIAKITDQIRRLSAGDDMNSIIVSSEIDCDNFTTIQPSEAQEKIIPESDDNFSLSFNEILDEGSSKLSTEVQVGDDDSLEKDFSSIKVEIKSPIVSDQVESSSKLARDEIDRLDEILELSERVLRRKNNFEHLYSSLDTPKTDESELPPKPYISSRSTTIDNSIFGLKDESRSLDTESMFYPRFISGHMPISPVIVDEKIGKPAKSKLWSPDAVPALDERVEASPDVKESVFDSKATGLTLNYSSNLNIYPNKKIISPKTPESVASFSSGETMGPDSKVTSEATTPLRSDSCKFETDRSGRCSSLSSDSKTLTLLSIVSDGHSRSKGELKAELTKPSFEQSDASSSTPMSTDSLRNKSEVSPSKLIVSSSSESYNSPGKVKYSERSFSSELQSPISANSIKYVTSYRGAEDLAESSEDAGSTTSPFYPIVTANEKSPSPNCAMSKLKNGENSCEIASERPSNFKDSSKLAVYLFEETATKGSDIKLIKGNDDYDSARPFEAELAATLSAKRLKNDTEIIVNNVDVKKMDTMTRILDDDYEIYLETDKISPFKSTLLTVTNIDGEKNKNYSGKTRESKLFERSSSSLDKRVGELTSLEDFQAIKKRSSDILADLRHLEAASPAATTTADLCMTKKTGYDWEELKNLEARRQDTFSDSASEFSKYRLDIPSISVSTEGRKGYVVEPKIQIDDNSDSILKHCTQKKDNGETDDDRESKLGVWTKVKPRKKGENGRRSSSDRALKIIQENSAILHKILTCQAKKCLPDLEEISKEITISPINEEISKIFSPILEKMGLNEHEINEELARINFKDFDQMTVTSGSEFDVKINDELCKLSLIDDEEVSHLDVNDMIASDYSDTREALIDKQINEELSKLLANYEQASPISQVLRDKCSSSQNPSEIEGLDISSISTNVFSYKSSNDSIETKSDLSSIQDSVIHPEKFSQYTESMRGENYSVSSTKYQLANLSPRSDIDIYRELEKLDKISSARVFPLDHSVTGQLISPNKYPTKSSPVVEVPPTAMMQTFDSSPLTPRTTVYKPFSRISPRKNSTSPFTTRFSDRSRNYDDVKRQSLSKETLEFRVRYDNHEDDFSLEPYQTDLPDLDRGASYYADESPINIKGRSMDTERVLATSSVVSPLEYSYDSGKYSSGLPDSYVYPKSTTSGDYERKTYQLSDAKSDVGSYMPVRRRESHSLSPNYQFSGHDFVSCSSTYAPKLSPSLEAAGPVEPLSHSEFSENLGVLKYPEVSSRDSLAYRKASMTLGPLDTPCRVSNARFITPSPKTQFSPFPVRNTTRRPKELGLKLGLYSPSSPGNSSGQSKRS